MTDLEKLAARDKKENLWEKVVRHILTGPHMAALLEFYFFVLLKGRIEAIENIPEGPCILAFNHESYLDWLLTFHIFNKKYGKKINFLAKYKLFKNPVWKIYLKYSNAIIIDESNTSIIRQAFTAIRRRISSGHIIGIFPEGRRTSNGEMQEGRPGIANLVASTKVPILPVGLKGFYRAWPRHKKIPGVARCTIRIGKPIKFSSNGDINKKERNRKITELIMKKIKETIDEIKR
ncbi:MAG: 1-acyl-sn-glycerol-3-phosphate acyltransferase [Spirochaetales bacterium]|nr:1-acyl-sn-glycerol-3-phosphate acyltransferase [Spirochaetales bacterium]